jgi:deoxyribonuclease V
MAVTRSWPADAGALVALQERLGAEAAALRTADPWLLPRSPLLAAGCFIASPTGIAGPGSAGDPAWVAAMTWSAGTGAVVEEVVQATTVPAPYAPGLLALREGPALAAAVAALEVAPDVLLVDATGVDHPRRAGLALHLGAVLGIATVGVTHRALVARGEPPAELVRGATSPLLLDGEEVARWVCTRAGTRPIAAHAAWRTDPSTAASVVLATSTGAGRTPVPLARARTAARTARAHATATAVRVP